MNIPKSLSQSATKIFARILDRLGEDNHVRVSSGNGFMPLIAERIGQTKTGAQIVSLAHYYECNGDLMRDPEMTFLVKKFDGFPLSVWPMSFRQDGGFEALNVESVTITDEKISFRPKQQSAQTAFANKWLANLKAQQKL